MPLKVCFHIPTFCVSIRLLTFCTSSSDKASLWVRQSEFRVWPRLAMRRLLRFGNKPFPSYVTDFLWRTHSPADLPAQRLCVSAGVCECECVCSCKACKHTSSKHAAGMCFLQNGKRMCVCVCSLFKKRAAEVEVMTAKMAWCHRGAEKGRKWAGSAVQLKRKWHQSGKLSNRKWDSWGEKKVICSPLLSSFSFISFQR